LYNRHLSHQQDHVPVSIEDNAYTTGITKTADNFRKRSNGLKKQDMDGYDSSDVDLFDSKSSKFRQKKEEQKKASLKRDWLIVFALTFWAAYIRLYKISHPPSVVFDVSKKYHLTKRKRERELIYK
jgi:dolichyl-phosphate-mannose-protein mannosyltransferase